MGIGTEIEGNELLEEEIVLGFEEEESRLGEDGKVESTLGDNGDKLEDGTTKVQGSGRVEMVWGESETSGEIETKGVEEVVVGEHKKADEGVEMNSDKSKTGPANESEEMYGPDDEKEGEVVVSRAFGEG